MNKIKHFLAHDGNKIGLFDSLREAEKAAALYEGWTEEEFEKVKQRMQGITVI